MASSTKKLMYLDLEFYDESKFGYINFSNGAGLPGATFGLGDVGNKSLGLYGTANIDTFMIKDFSSLSIEDVEQITVSSPSLKITLENPNKIGAINFYNESLNDYIQQDATNWNLDNSKGMTLETTGTLAFVNPKTNRMIGVFDLVYETFNWDGYFGLGSVSPNSKIESQTSDDDVFCFSINSVANVNPSFGFKIEDVIQWKISIDNVSHDFLLSSYDDSTEIYTDVLSIQTNKITSSIQVEAPTFYNDSGIEVSYEGHTHDNYYTQDELDNGQLDSRYYTESEVDSMFSATEGYTQDELDNGVLDTRYYTESEINSLLNELKSDILALQENKVYEYTGSEWIQIEDPYKNKTVSDVSKLPTSDTETWRVIISTRMYKFTYYEWDGSDWIEVADPFDGKKVSSIDDLPASSTDMYVVTGGGYMRYNGAEWEEVEFASESVESTGDLPPSPAEGDIYYVKDLYS